MFSHYLIQNVQGEDILYLYMTYQYEFSEEFGSYSEKDLRVLSSNFIKTNHIPFKGHKIYFVVDGFVVKKIDMDYSDFLYYAPDQFYLQMKLEDQSRCEISLREYLISILFSYYNTDIGDEVFKCICILFNTYAYLRMSKDGYLTCTDSFGPYLPSLEYRNLYSHYDEILKRINGIIDFCSCMFLGYHQEYVLPFIHYSNNGRTLSSIKYPYLSSVKSLWDITSRDYLNIVDYNYSTLSDLLQVKIDSHSTIEVLNNGYSMKFGYKTFLIRELKEMLHLKSNDISVIVNRDKVRFVTRGIGNGLGLSIFGSICLENNGCNYEEILRYYFPKCMLYKNIKELSN